MVLRTYLVYNTVVQFCQFFCCSGKVLLRPENKKILVVCLAGRAVVSVFGSGGKLAVFLLWRESFITTGKNKSSSHLSGGLCCCVSFWFWRLRLEIKKFPVICLAGCAVVSVFGSGDYDRKKKKIPVVCLAGCAVVSVFGSGDYDRKK